MSQCYNPYSYYDFDAIQSFASYAPLSVIAPIAAIYTGNFKIFTLLCVGSSAILHFSGVKPFNQLENHFVDIYHYNIDNLKCYFGMSNYYNPKDYNNFNLVKKNHDICLEKGIYGLLGIYYTKFSVKILGYELVNTPDNEIDINDCKKYAIDTYVLRLEDSLINEASI